MGWRDNYFKMLQCISKQHSFHVIFINLSDNSFLNISNICGANLKIDRRILWNKCLDFRSFAPGSSILGGDFNVTLFLEIVLLLRVISLLWRNLTNLLLILI